MYRRLSMASTHDGESTGSAGQRMIGRSGAGLLGLRRSAPHGVANIRGEDGVRPFSAVLLGTAITGPAVVAGARRCGHHRDPACGTWPPSPAHTSGPVARVSHPRQTWHTRWCGRESPVNPATAPRPRSLGAHRCRGGLRPSESRARAMWRRGQTVAAATRSAGRSRRRRAGRRRSSRPAASG